MTEFEEQKNENDDEGDGNDGALKFSACNNDLNMKLRRERVNVQRRGIFSTLKKMFGMVTEKKFRFFFFVKMVDVSSIE